VGRGRGQDPVMRAGSEKKRNMLSIERKNRWKNSSGKREGKSKGDRGEPRNNDNTQRSQLGRDRGKREKPCKGPTGPQKTKNLHQRKTLDGAKELKRGGPEGTEERRRNAQWQNTIMGILRRVRNEF